MAETTYMEIDKRRDHGWSSQYVSKCFNKGQADNEELFAPVNVVGALRQRFTVKKAHK